MVLGGRREDALDRNNNTYMSYHLNEGRTALQPNACHPSWERADSFDRQQQGTSRRQEACESLGLSGSGESMHVAQSSMVARPPVSMVSSFCCLSAASRVMSKVKEHLVHCTLYCFSSSAKGTHSQSSLGLGLRLGLGLG